MIFLHKFPEINLSPYAHTSGNVCGDCPCHNMPRVSLWSSVDLQIRGARLCIYHPHAQGVLLTHFGSCLEAVDSESQIRCHNISTRVSRDQSQPICTQTWYVFFGIVHVTTCSEIFFEAVSICKSEGHVCVYAIHTLRACYFRILVAA